MSEYNNNFENKDNMDQYGFQGGELNQAPARKSKKTTQRQDRARRKKAGRDHLERCVVWRGGGGNLPDSEPYCRLHLLYDAGSGQHLCPGFPVRHPGIPERAADRLGRGGTDSQGESGCFRYRGIRNAIHCLHHQ